MKKKKQETKTLQTIAIIVIIYLLFFRKKKSVVVQAPAPQTAIAPVPEKQVIVEKYLGKKQWIIDSQINANYMATPLVLVGNDGYNIFVPFDCYLKSARVQISNVLGNLEYVVESPKTSIQAYITRIYPIEANDNSVFDGSFDGWYNFKGLKVHEAVIKNFRTYDKGNIIFITHGTNYIITQDGTPPENLILLMQFIFEEL